MKLLDFELKEGRLGILLMCYQYKYIINESAKTIRYTGIHSVLLRPEGRLWYS